MKIPGKKFALVTAPLVVAAVMLGVPLAGSAHALQRQTTCQLLLEEAYNYYDEAHTDFYYEDRAEEAGNWASYFYYSYLAGLNTQLGDDASHQANNLGC